MTRYKITIEYDGSGFCGWQRQENGFSIQEAIENAILELTGGACHSTTTSVKRRSLRGAVGDKAISGARGDIFLYSSKNSGVAASVGLQPNPSRNDSAGRTPFLYGSGRTDAGVHAYGQVAHFDLEKLHAPERIVGALNFYLKNHKISILNCEIVPKEFHARFSAKSRSYIYKIINRSARLCLDHNRAWHIKVPLDVGAMQKAATYLIGKHDFSSFRAQGCAANSPIRSISAISISRYRDDIQIYVKAPSFLYHMVRNIVGSLVMVGKGSWPPEYILEILEAKDRSIAGPTAPACGLYFLTAEYSDN
jgi:tRNA pseudouridine38-40 synthase